MILRLTRGDPMNYSIAGYKPYVPAPSKDPVANLEYFRRQLVRRRYDPLAAVELEHMFSPACVTQPFKGKQAHSSILLLLDNRAREILEIEGLARYSDGINARVALTMDVALYLLGVQTLSVKVCEDVIQQEPGIMKRVRTPGLVRPSVRNVTAERVQGARAKAELAHLRLREPAGFDKLHEYIPLQNLLELTDFVKHGEFVGSPD